MSGITMLYITFGVIILLVVLVGVLIVKVAHLQKRSEGEKSELLLHTLESLKQDMVNRDNHTRTELQSKFENLNNTIRSGSELNFKTIQKQFEQSSELIKDVTERLVNLDKTNLQVLDFSKKMQSLENILKNPKQRGILGEYFLETLLGNVLQPQQYKMQYKFNDGTIVDSVIFYRDKIIPIDAKFSLEKYNLMMETQDQNLREQYEKDFKRDIKARIDETAKYILPKENTTEFAFMFIPAEGVYYNLLIYNVGSVQINTRDLIEYAFQKHVIIVSPTSFYAYLETVLQGLKAQKIEENVKQIIKRIHDLNSHLQAYEDFMGKLGGNLTTTVNSYNRAVKEFKKVDKDIYRITDKESGGTIDLDILQGPSFEEE